MENASKALLMAGGVLIAIIIVSALVIMFNTASDIPRAQEQAKEAEELATFNKKYETYARDNIKGTDVMTLANMAISNNEKYNGQANYQITVGLQLNHSITGKKMHYQLNNSTQKVEKQEFNLTTTLNRAAHLIL